MLKQLILPAALALLAALSLCPAARALEAYEIEAEHNDEIFIINGEKFKAMTFCLGWYAGQHVVFLEGSPLGACASAELYNIERREKCRVWCE